MESNTTRIDKSAQTNAASTAGALTEGRDKGVEAGIAILDCANASVRNGPCRKR